MIGHYDPEEIKSDVEGIIVHSQDYPFYLDARELIRQWQTAKASFIAMFGGKTFVRSEKPIKVELSKEQSSRKFDECVNLLDENSLLNDELKDFLLINKEGFFENKVILPYPSRNIPLGSKLSKSIKKFLPNQEVTRRAQDTISHFIQENKIEGYLYLSVDPRDFLTISENNANWRSCHSLDGDYRAGNLSYMVDHTTMIAYLASDKQERLKCLPQGMIWNSKKWRMLVHTDMVNCIYYGRQYPCESEVLLHETYRLLTKYLGTLFDSPVIRGFKNVTMGDESRILSNNQIYYMGRVFDTRDIIDVSSYIGYCDLTCSNFYEPVVSLDLNREYTLCTGCYSHFKMKKEDVEKIVHQLFDIKIGERPICPKCGKVPISREGSFLCEGCIKALDADRDFYLTCDDCGRRIYDEDEIFYYEGEHFCKKCYRDIIKNV